MSESQDEFYVLLRGLKLPPDVSKRIEGEIRRVVLDEIAHMDLKGDITIKNLPKVQEFQKRIGPTSGIWVEPAQDNL